MQNGWGWEEAKEWAKFPIAAAGGGWEGAKASLRVL